MLRVTPPTAAVAARGDVQEGAAGIGRDKETAGATGGRTAAASARLRRKDESFRFESDT